MRPLATKIREPLKEREDGATARKHLDILAAMKKNGTLK
jgi:hypothetical protein